MGSLPDREKGNLPFRWRIEKTMAAGTDSNLWKLIDEVAPDSHSWLILYRKAQDISGDPWLFPRRDDWHRAIRALKGTKHDVQVQER